MRYAFIAQLSTPNLLQDQAKPPPPSLVYLPDLQNAWRADGSMPLTGQGDTPVGKDAPGGIARRESLPGFERGETAASFLQKLKRKKYQEHKPKL